MTLLSPPFFAVGQQPRSPEDSERRATHVTQRGVIEINGCVVSRDDLKLTATPLSSSVTSGDKDADDDDDRDDNDSHHRHVRHAQIRSTRDPHVFRFAIPDLSTRKAYILNTGLRTVCGRMTWTGPKRGIIVPASRKPVRIQGFVLTTKIDIQTTDASGNVKFMGADALTSASATRVFRWHTDLPGVTSAELQIAIDRFTSSTDTPDTCANPSGLITKLSLSPTDQREDFTSPIDFNNLIFGNPGITAGTSRLIQFQVAHGAPLYVRVVPLDNAGIPRCDVLADGAAAIAVLMYLPIQNSPSFVANPSLLISGDYSPALPVAVGSQCVRVVKFHTIDSIIGPDLFWENAFANAGDVHNNAIGQGVTLCLPASTPSTLEDIGDFISGVIEGIAVIVDSFADLYDEIKKDVVHLVASAIQKLGIINCDQGSLCQDELNAALDAALSALGLPPSLPNFEELANRGVDYLAEEASEESGLPVDEAVDIIRKMIGDSVNAQGGSGNALPDWLVFDNHFRPSQLTLNLTRPATLQALPDDLIVFPNPTIYPLLGTVVKIPSSLAPTGASIIVPIQLLPNLDGTADPPPFYPFGPQLCQPLPKEFVLEFKLNDWYQNRFLTTQCTEFDLDGVHPQAGVGEDLGAHTVATQVPAHFDPGHSNTCNR